MSERESNICSRYFVLTGRVQGVGFRKWLKRKSDLLGVVGWVSNVGDDKVEGVFQGDKKIVHDLLNSCGNGPARAEVKKITSYFVDEKPSDSFEIIVKPRVCNPSSELGEISIGGARASLFSVFPAKSKKAKSKELFNYISEFSYSDLTDKDVVRTKLLILDALGLMYLASKDSRMEKIRKMGIELSAGAGGATALGIEGNVSPCAAAFVHSAYMQLYDFNDGHRVAAARGGDAHPGRTIIPSAIAEAEYLKASGKQLITAVAVAYDVSAKLRGRGELKPKSPQYASAAASAKLRNLPLKKISCALGYAGYLSASRFASKSSGVVPDSLSKALQSFTALVAVRIAEAGQSGPEIKFSPLRSVPFLLSDAGTGREVSKVYIKPYPTCRMTHAAIEALGKAMDELSVGFYDIKGIKVQQLPAGMYVAKIPKSNIRFKNAQFNLYYCLARYAKDRAMTVDQFSSHKLEDPDIYEMIKKIEVAKSGELASGYPNSNRPSIVEVISRDGRSATCRVDLANGNEVDLASEMVIDKFYNNSLSSIDRKSAEKIVDNVMNLEIFESVPLALFPKA